MRFAFVAALVLSAATGCTLEFDPSLLDEQGCGCTDGVSCLAGNTPQACGKNGSLCEQCNAPLSVCFQGACAAENAVVSLSLADGHTGVVDRNGGLWLWGQNTFGATGQPTSTTEQDTPARISPAIEFRNVAVGGSSPELFSCAIAKPGDLYCWGINTDGQAALGDLSPDETPTRVGSDSDWLSVGAGRSFACGLRAPGSLYCWGYDGPGHRLGLASLPSDTKTPQLVPGSESWTKLSVGDNHSCAIRSDQSLWCWGEGESGQLGHAEVIGPAQVDGGTSFVAVAAGGTHTCGIRSNGTLWCWGDNGRGELGLPQSTSAPVEVDEHTDWISIATGALHSCGVRADGALSCWGAGDSGQLGNGAFDDAASPVPVSDPGPWVQVEAGTSYSCAAKADGTLWCWGSNGVGQLGIANPTFQPAPSPTSVLLE